MLLLVARSRDCRVSGYGGALDLFIGKSPLDSGHKKRASWPSGVSAAGLSFEICYWVMLSDFLEGMLLGWWRSGYSDSGNMVSMVLTK